MKYDLHLHSDFSDGTESVSEILYKLKEFDIKYFAITDHDNLSSIDELRKHKEDMENVGMRYINGIEFSCVLNDIEMHILGYGFDADNLLIRDFVENARVMRYTKRDIKVQAFRDKYNIEFTDEELARIMNNDRLVGSLVFAKVLANRGYSGSFDYLMKKFVKPLTGLAYEVDVHSALQTIKKSGGVSILAHPKIIMDSYNMDFDMIDELIGELCKKGLDGVEVFHSKHTKEDVILFEKLARKHGLLATGGSDYHGGNKKGVTIGKACETELTLDSCEIVGNFISKMFVDR